MAAIGKRRDDGQQRKRRESGVRRRDHAGLLEPQVQEDAASIEWLLDQTWQRLSQMPETALRGELRLVVERYRRTLREWEFQAPTHVQRAILLDCVKALHGRVASRSVRDPSSK